GPLRRWCRLSVAALLLGGSSPASAQPAQVNTIADAFARLRTCWKPPEPSRVHPDIDITVIVSFNRAAEILGRPRVTYESEQAADNDGLFYRLAVMET